MRPRGEVAPWGGVSTFRHIGDRVCHGDERERQRLAQRDVEERDATNRNALAQVRQSRGREDGQESVLERENRQGFGRERDERADVSIDEDQELGR